ncbi:MAG: hypothetical protein AAF802_26815 [Planctomycetota bacterium]
MPQKTVAPSDARKAILLFREAVNRIRLLHRSAIPRWSDGMIAWFADERPPEEREESILYNDEELDRYREARDLLVRAIELNPYCPDAYLLLGNACSAIDGDNDAMLQYYNVAISLDPENDEFHNARMAHYLSIGLLDNALIDLEHLERLESGYAASMREHYENARNGG